MPFSAATCLTYTGTTTLGNTIEVYVDSDSYGSLFTTVSLTDITTNCPYYFLNVPDGTNNIKLLDPVSCCYCIIPVQSNDLCTTCDLNFNTYSATTVGQIVAGNITGSCDANITDYLISWYEVGDPINPVFTSGKGSEFAPYLYTHPLTGTSSVLVPSGTYEPIIDKVIVNGLTFSQTGGTGTIPANLDCLPSFTVNALTCDNGTTSNLPQYEHRFTFSGATAGVLPEPLSTTFELSAGTNFFAWRFRGFAVPDKLKLTFVGSSYSDSIILEYWEVGDGLVGNNFNINTFPKSADTSVFLHKVTCLSGLTVNNGDNILIEVIPSTATTQTNWDFYCGCLDEFNCDFCEPWTANTVSGTTSYQLPIIGSSITGITGSCNTIRFFCSLSGCLTSDIIQTSLYKYVDLATGNPPYSNNGILTNSTINMYLSNRQCENRYSYYSVPQICSNNGSIITYKKEPNLFTITSNSLSTISAVYNDYLSNILTRISPFSGDPTNINYYSTFEIRYPASTGLTPCGDGTIQRQIVLHQSSVVTTGTTGSDYYIEFTMPSITYGLTGYTSCDINCTSNPTAFVNTVNNHATGSTFNYTGTTNVGSIYTNTMFNFLYIFVKTTPVTANTISSFVTLNQFQNVTVPASGVSYTLLPSLSGETCPDILNNYYPSSGPSYPNSVSFSKFYFSYVFTLFDPLDFKNFRIFANAISSNGLSNGGIKTLVYEFSGGTVTYSNPEYII